MKQIAMTLMLGLMFVAGCKQVTVSHPPPPGAVNSTDEAFYQALSAAQAALNSLKASEPSAPQIKTALNQAINDYNLADIAYQTFHAALLAGQNPSSTPVQNAITAVQNDLTAVQGAK